ncbi:MAG: MBL fold metallo-hydrolase [Verrucomicrobiales bacterium]|nr:MBL fold metallo-hydrolase [Verrucomicrobiales bacterium]MCP5560018.1 MBL fold metallo-hydrolase [Verrucomicrobiaceae bacterium]
MPSSTTLPYHKAMKNNTVGNLHRWLALVLISVMIPACAHYNPLEDVSLRLPHHTGGLKVTFVGNSTFLISDGKTHLMVDGFVSRPGPPQTLFGRIGPDSREIQRVLDALGVRKLDAILVGHAHHDHALDATSMAKTTGAVVIGSDSVGYIYEGAVGSRNDGGFIEVPHDGLTQRWGAFTIRFAPSDHVSSHLLPQTLVEGCIKAPLKMPAHFWRFKCGQVFALHITHPDGSFVVTTTAGAKAGQFKGLKADVVFLGVGFLSKECSAKQDHYWKHTVQSVDPRTVIPIHWDDFSRKLHRGLKPLPTDDLEAAINLVRTKAEAERRVVRVMDCLETLWMRKGKVIGSSRDPL